MLYNRPGEHYKGDARWEDGQYPGTSHVRSLHPKRSSVHSRKRNQKKHGSESSEAQGIKPGMVLNHIWREDEAAPRYKMHCSFTVVHGGLINRLWIEFFSKSEYHCNFRFVSSVRVSTGQVVPATRPYGATARATTRKSKLISSWSNVKEQTHLLSEYSPCL